MPLFPPADQNVHRVVMEVLQCPFQAPPGRPGERPLVDAKQIHAPEHRAVQLMCILGYKLLKAMVRARPLKASGVGDSMIFSLCIHLCYSPLFDTISSHSQDGFWDGYEIDFSTFFTPTD